MKDISIKEFAEEHGACRAGVDWALKHCKSGMMSEAYEKLAKGRSDAVNGFWDWTWTRCHDDKTLRLLAVRFVRQTPLADGRMVVGLLTDQRSLDALAAAERYANGEIGKEELNAAWAAAWDSARDAASAAAWAAWDAASAAAWDAASAAAWAAWAAAWDSARDAARAARAAAWDAARDAASAAQKRMILDLGNPFKD